MESKRWQGYEPALRHAKEQIVSDDGSLTLYSQEFNESYHSPRDGALRESLNKHVIPALRLHQGKASLTILDICYGLGYNTLATLHYIQTNNLDLKVHILSPEFDEALVRSLKDFAYPKAFEPLRPVIEAISESFCYEDEQFSIKVLIGDARESIPRLPARKVDIVYQDAFSPKVNPLLWTREWFADIRALCSDDAVVTTYSTAAATRMALHENGFELHYYDAPDTRRSLIASPRRIESLEWIDMALKIARNPDARSLSDSRL
jgi:tRNA U34 5-methylaminomethyl-2-thiouridine-forming methyltransferase MnmC